MTLVASHAEWHGETERPLYDDYWRFPFFAQRADWITQHYPAARTVLIVGAAYGYLIDELHERGREAWGIEMSEHAIQAAEQAIGAKASFVVRGDATSPDDLAKCCRAAHVQRFDLAVTEDILPCCTDAEAQLLIGNVREVADAVLHIVTPGRSEDTHRDPRLNWKPIEEWKQRVEPDAVLDAESWVAL